MDKLIYFTSGAIVSTVILELYARSLGDERQSKNVRIYQIYDERGTRVRPSYLDGYFTNFHSSYKIYKMYKKDFKHTGLTYKLVSHPAIVRGCLTQYVVDFNPQETKIHCDNNN